MTIRYEGDTRFGECAVRAIAALFRSHSEWIELVANLKGVKNPEQGLNFFECKKVINAVGKLLERRYRYVPNSVGLTYLQVVWLYYDGIVMFDEHLSFFRGWEVVDDWMSPEGMNDVPTGFWIRQPF